MRMDPPCFVLSRGALVWLACFGCTGCAASDGPGETATFVMSRLDFVTEPEADGTVRGFNLDGVDHTGGADAKGCFKPDYVSPEGESGVDNQLSSLGAALVVFGADSVSAIVQNMVNEGTLLLIIEVGDLHDWENDPHVTLRFRLGMGPVDVGTDSRLVPGQSFDPRPGYQFEATRSASIRDGVLYADDVNVTPPSKSWASTWTSPCSPAAPSLCSTRGSTPSLAGLEARSPSARSTSSSTRFTSPRAWTRG